MALRSFNVQGGLSIGNKGDIFDANANLNLSNSIANVTLGAVGNLHISGGNANAAVLGTVTLDGNGNVTAIAITSRGDGYTIAPTITITGANTTEANATVSLYANGALDTITINTAGTGYNSGTVAATVTAPSTRYLQTDGSGTLAWSEVAGAGGGGGGGTPGGSNTEIQFNDNGSFNGAPGFTFNKTSNAVTANGTITGTNFVGANLRNGNSSVAIAANGNVTVTATSNATLVISDTGANITGTANISGNTVVGNLSVTGNVQSNLLPNANVTYDLGSDTQRWKDIWLANSTIYLGSQNISANATTVTFTGNVSANNLGGNLSGNLISGNVVNGTSNVLVTANSVVLIGANGQGNIVNVYSNGTHATTTLTNDVLITGNITVQGNTNYINVETYVVEDPIIQLGSGANGAVPAQNTNDLGTLLMANTAADGAINRFMGWDTSNAEFGFASNASESSNVVTFNNYGNVRALNFIGKLANGNSNIAITSNANIVVTANGNTMATFTSSGDGNVQTTGTEFTGYITSTANITATGNLQVSNDAVIEGNLSFAGNYTNANTYFSKIGYARLTTTSATANQAIVQIPAANGRAIEFVVKGIDSAGAKYAASTIMTLVGNAANADCDYTQFAAVAFGTSPGTVSVALTDSNANITLQVTPASTNSTVWTTQWRLV